MPPISDTLDLLVAPLKHSAVTRERDHRPWPMPRRPWVMAQTWKHLLFAHWDTMPQALARIVPAPLTLDTFEGRAWIGVTPFALHHLRVRLTMPVPVLSTFPEINVRTYVSVDDKPGIYFLSLDAASRLAVEAARRLYRLPYFRARMAIDCAAEVLYRSERVDPDAPAPAAFRARYGPNGESFRPRPGTLEHWLTERYCLYTLDEHARPLRGEIHHPPWNLQPGVAQIEVNTMTAEAGLTLHPSPLLHYARRQDVVFWPLAAA